MKKIIYLILATVALNINAYDLYISHFIGDRNGIVLGFQTIPNWRYWIETSTNLVDWTTATNFTANGYAYSAFFSSDDINVNKQRYFRVKYTCTKQ